MCAVFPREGIRELVTSKAGVKGLSGNDWKALRDVRNALAHKRNWLSVVTDFFAGTNACAAPRFFKALDAAALNPAPNFDTITSRAECESLLQQYQNTEQMVRCKWRAPGLRQSELPLRVTESRMPVKPDIDMVRQRKGREWSKESKTDRRWGALVAV
jgi:hypothetical protein